MAKKDTKQEEKSPKIEELETKVVELEEAYARARADYANFEKRVKQQQSQFMRIASVTVLAKVMGILDNLEMAAKHISDPGLDLVVDQANKLLEEEGATEVKALDQVFNPESMECQEMVPGEKDIVQKVVQKGFWLDSHLIRPAKVLVGNGEKATSKE